MIDFQHMKARILLKADEGLTDIKIAEHLSVGVHTVERVRQRCAFEGLSAALNPKRRPPRKPKMDGEAEARLVQLACSAAPDGRQRWTLRLLADRLVELDVVDSISHETVRQRLKKRAETLENAKVFLRGISACRGTASRRKARNPSHAQAWKLARHRRDRAFRVGQAVSSPAYRLTG